jgi:hypothetical protein
LYYSLSDDAEDDRWIWNIDEMIGGGKSEDFETRLSRYDSADPN